MQSQTQSITDEIRSTMLGAEVKLTALLEKKARPTEMISATPKLEVVDTLMS